MYGNEARKALHKLSRQFWSMGIPNKGRYVTEPALFNEEGPIYIPPARTNYLLIGVAAATVLLITGLMIYKKRSRVNR